MRTIHAIAAAGLLCSGAGASASETLQTLYSFQSTSDGKEPTASIAFDRKGDLFGTTRFGGARNLGAVFELTPPATGHTMWTEAVLNAFPTPKIDGGQPNGGAVVGPHGEVYGTTTFDGRHRCGTVFELLPVSGGWQQITLWEFGALGGDACEPYAALTLDQSGAIYGNSLYGGKNGYGVVFKITPPKSSGKAAEALLFSFDGTGGSGPASQMTFDAAGNLYGTTRSGDNGFGTVWKLTPPAQGATVWAGTILWQFSGQDGESPAGGPLVFDKAGALYGTCGTGGAGNYGVVFKVSPPQGSGTAWTESTVFSFDAQASFPNSGVVFSSKGDLIGTTSSGDGAVYRLQPPAAGGTAWRENLLWQFSGSDGSNPESPLVLRPHGVIFGTTATGGTSGYGTVWKLTP
jgi:uncharacterized repeat protein (TIGR03803 family)